MKARFLSPQPPAKVVVKGDRLYAYICQNEVRGTEVFDGEEVEYIEYDYNEFVDSPGREAEILANPGKYLNFQPAHEPTEAERLAALEDYVASLEVVS